MVHRRLLRHLHIHDDHALRLDLPHHDHVRHLDCVMHRDHVREIIRLLACARRYFPVALHYFLLLPGHHGRLHNHLHHLPTDSHP